MRSRHNPSKLEPFIPQPDIEEPREVRVAAPAGLVFEVAQHIDLESIPVVRFIVWLRAKILGGQVERKASRGFFQDMEDLGWGLLQHEPGRAMVMGAVTQPWLGNVKFLPLPRGEFAIFAKPDLVKIAWTLETEPLDSGHSIFRIDTRAAATDEGARTKFRRYWRWVRPGVVLIRLAALRTVRLESERRFRGLAQSPSSA